MNVIQNQVRGFTPGDERNELEQGKRKKSHWNPNVTEELQGPLMVAVRLFGFELKRARRKLGKVAVVFKGSQGRELRA